MSPTPAAGRNELVGLEDEIETPENVVLTYQLAGPAVRLGAYVIDLAVRAAATGIIVMALSMTSIALPGLSAGLIFVFLFLINWGYFVVCEWFLKGKTPGKFLFGLRVIQEHGYPVSFWAVMLRNLLRGAEAPLMYGPSIITMMLTPRFQRLGDLVARTMVISEGQIQLPREPVILEKIQPLSREDLGGYRPDSRTLGLIEEFLERRHVLTHARGHALAWRLARALANRLQYRGDAQLVQEYPMAFLARVYVTFMRVEEDDDEEGAEQRWTAGQRPGSPLAGVGR